MYLVVKTADMTIRCHITMALYKAIVRGEKGTLAKLRKGAAQWVDSYQFSIMLVDRHGSHTITTSGVVGIDLAA